MNVKPMSVLAPYAQDTGAFRVNNKGASELANACVAVRQLIKDNRAALAMLEVSGMGDSPVAAFMRAAISRITD